MALTNDGEVYIWGAVRSSSSLHVPQPIPELSGKNITHVMGGPNHLVFWSGDAKSISHSLAPFTPLQAAAQPLWAAT